MKSLDKGNYVRVIASVKSPIRKSIIFDSDDILVVVRSNRYFTTVKECGKTREVKVATQNLVKLSGFDVMQMSMNKIKRRIGNKLFRQGKILYDPNSPHAFTKPDKH